MVELGGWLSEGSRTQDKGHMPRLCDESELLGQHLGGKH